MRSAVFPHSLPYSHYRYYRRECGRGLAVRMRSIITGYRNNTEQTERWMCPWTLQWCIQWAAKLSVISCAKHSIPISDCSIDWKIETEPNRVGNRFVDRSNNPFCTGKPSDNCFPRLEYCVFFSLEQWPDQWSSSLAHWTRFHACRRWFQKWRNHNVTSSSYGEHRHLHRLHAVVLLFWTSW